MDDTHVDFPPLHIAHLPSGRVWSLKHLYGQHLWILPDLISQCRHLSRVLLSRRSQPSFTPELYPEHLSTAWFTCIRGPRRSPKLAALTLVNSANGAFRRSYGWAREATQRRYIEYRRTVKSNPTTDLGLPNSASKLTFFDSDRDSSY